MSACILIDERLQGSWNSLESLAIPNESSGQPCFKSRRIILFYRNQHNTEISAKAHIVYFGVKLTINHRESIFIIIANKPMISALGVKTKAQSSNCVGVDKLSCPEDLVHLAGPITEDGIVRVLQQRSAAGHNYVSSEMELPVRVMNDNGCFI